MDKGRFIKGMAPMAKAVGNEYNVLPLLIMCQAILESNWGQSDLAKDANNFFGIKKGMGWTGPVYEKRTKEWSKARGWFEVVAEFRLYDSPADCFRDLAEKYHTARYAEVVGVADLTEAATAAWRAGYATDPTYPAKLQNVAATNATELGGLELAVKVITIDAGHAGFGKTPGKRGPDGKFEWVWNNAVVVHAIRYLLDNYKNVKIIRVDDPTGRTDVSLTTRANRANQAGSDLHISVHHNALGSSWIAAGIGVETFRQIGLSVTASSGRAQAEIHKRLVPSMNLKDRGPKSANLAMTRLTWGPSVLTEGGFMDSRVDRSEMDKDARMKLQAHAIMDGAAAFLKLPRETKPTPAPAKPVADAKKYYRVRISWQDAESQIGAFLDVATAIRLADTRQSDGYKVFDPDGKIAHVPKAPTPPPHPVEIEEEDEMVQVAIVVNTEADVRTVWKLHTRTGWPIWSRAALDEDLPVAKKIVAVGGGMGDLENYADEVELLSGKNWEETVAAVYAYMKSL